MSYLIVTQMHGITNPKGEINIYKAVDGPLKIVFEGPRQILLLTWEPP